MKTNMEVLQVIALTEVTEHPVIEQLSKQYCVPPLTNVSGESMKMPGLLALARQFVFDLVKNKTTYYCVNNLRIFRVLKALCPGCVIIARVLRRIRTDEMSQRILGEMLITPVFGGILNRDLPRLGSAWERLRMERCFEELLHETGARGLARLLRVDVRRLRGGRNV